MSLFDDFTKVEKREEIIPEKSDLDKILNLETEIITQYKNDSQFGKNSQDHEEAYTTLYANVQEKTKDIPLNSELLESYISTRDNLEKNTEAIIRGMYSAALLEATCVVQPNTAIFIDGEGKTFNYLFYHVKNARNVTIQNFKGDNILAKAGWQGEVAHITLNNIEGDELLSSAGLNGSCEHIILTDITGNHTLSQAGSEKGSIKYLRLTNINGDSTLWKMGSFNGTAQHITLDNIKGDDTLASAGFEGNVEYLSINNLTGNKTLAYAGKNSGSINQLTLHRIKGDYTLQDISTCGNATHITLTKIEGNQTLEGAGSDNGNIHHLTLSKITGDLTLSDLEGDCVNIKNLTLSEINGNDTFKNANRYGGKINPILREEDFNEHQKSILSQIETIISTIHTLSFEEQKNAHDEIARLQIEIFAGET